MALHSSCCSQDLHGGCCARSLLGAQQDVKELEQNGGGGRRPRSDLLSKVLLRTKLHKTLLVTLDTASVAKKITPRHWHRSFRYRSTASMNINSKSTLHLDRSSNREHNNMESGQGQQQPRRTGRTSLSKQDESFSLSLPLIFPPLASGGQQMIGILPQAWT